MKAKKRRCEKREKTVKGMLLFLQDLWVIILALMLDLEGLFKIRKIYKYVLYYNVINNITIRDKIKWL